jgi:hypothetical protein
MSNQNKSEFYNGNWKAVLPCHNNKCLLTFAQILLQIKLFVGLLSPMKLDKGSRQINNITLKIEILQDFTLKTLKKYRLVLSHTVCPSLAYSFIWSCLFWTPHACLSTSPNNIPYSFICKIFKADFSFNCGMRCYVPVQ